jgi:hypothetical protein
MKSKGILRYKGTDSNWVVLDIDNEIARYYRTHIPKHIRFNIPKYEPHITVINGKYESLTQMGAWGRHEGEEIEFEYDNEIKFGEPYIWLEVRSKRFEEIRTELGVGDFFDKTKWFHITIANTKEETERKGVK